MMVEHKVAVIYGAGGAIGGAVARALAREGANLFLTGRYLPAHPPTRRRSTLSMSRPWTSTSSL